MTLFSSIFGILLLLLFACLWWCISGHSQTLFVLAAKEGNISDLGYFLFFAPLYGISTYHIQEAFASSCQNSHIECTRLILSKKYAKHIINSSVATLQLIKAVSLHKVELVHLLLERGVNVNSCDIYGSTPAYAAIQHNHIECLRILLAYNANINITERSVPLLLYAVDMFKTECVQLLLQYNADYTLTDVKGKSALSAVNEESWIRGHVTTAKTEIRKMILKAAEDTNYYRLK